MIIRTLNLSDSVAQFDAQPKSATPSHLLPQRNALKAEMKNTMAEQQNQIKEELGYGV